MERKQFDDELRAIVEGLDESFVPHFDRERVWEKSIGGRRKGMSYHFVAACAAIFLGLAFLLLNENETGKPKVVAKPVVGTVSRLDFEVKSATKVSPKSNFSQPKVEKTLTQIIKTTMPEEAVADTQNIESPVVPLLATSGMPMGQPSPDTTEFKVTFKRGRPLPAEPDLKISYAKGKKPTIKVKITPWADTTAYYVNTNSHRSINFKL